MKLLTPQKKAALIEAINEGKTNRAIARELACSTVTVSKLRAELAGGAAVPTQERDEPVVRRTIVEEGFTGGGDDGPVDGWETDDANDDDDVVPATAVEPDDDGMTLVNTEYLRTLEVVRDLVEENMRLRREVANG